MENPKTHNKNESNINFIPKPAKLRKKKKILLSMSVSAIWWSKSGKGADGGGETELCLFPVSFSVSQASSPLSPYFYLCVHSILIG